MDPDVLRRNCPTDTRRGRSGEAHHAVGERGRALDHHWDRGERGRAATYDERLANTPRCDGFVDPRAS